MTRRRGPLLRLGDPLFRSAAMTRRLFGVDPAINNPAGSNPAAAGNRLDHDAFDFATLALRQALPGWLPDAASIVEIGTGPNAVLAAWLHHRGHRVVAWEQHPPAAAQAAALLTAQLGPGAPVVCGARFDRDSAIDADIVIANPPYVPTGRATALGLDPTRPHAWDGGADGLAGYRALQQALVLRFRGPVIVGGSWHFHRPRRVATAMSARVVACRSFALGWALSLRF